MKNAWSCVIVLIFFTSFCKEKETPGLSAATPGLSAIELKSRMQGTWRDPMIINLGQHMVVEDTVIKIDFWDCIPWVPPEYETCPEEYNEYSITYLPGGQIEIKSTNIVGRHILKDTTYAVLFFEHKINDFVEIQMKWTVDLENPSLDRYQYHFYPSK